MVYAAEASENKYTFVSKAHGCKQQSGKTLYNRPREVVAFGERSLGKASH